MPYADHKRLTIAGDIAGTQGSVERWSIRLNLTDPANFSDDVAFFNDCVADVKAWAAAEVGLWGGAAVDQVKMADINSLGLYKAEAQVADFARVPFAGAGAVPAFPFQVACAVSLETGQFGPSRRGRCYLPVPLVTLEPDGQFQAGQATGLRDRFATLLVNLDNKGGLDANVPEVCIASLKGFNTVVNGVRVGRVLDTMRSRRRSLPEEYSAIAAVG